MAQRVFTQEEKARAAQRVADGERPVAVARDLGISDDTLRRWRAALGHAASTHGREPDGRFKKGFTANPGGCTVDAERAQKMLEQAAPATVEKMFRLVESIEDELDPELVEMLATKGHVLVKLYGQILDRGLGKPTQRVKQEAEDVAIIVDIGGD